MMVTIQSYILEVKNKRNSAIIYIRDQNIEVLECSNSVSCRIQGVKGLGCPQYCPFIVDAKKYLHGMKTKNKVEVLNTPS
ncbi:MULTISPECIES: hypothetical protein [unclassified Archaeoglobus]|jgi:hypothetical protein|uniref:hypothetical protein n=2 Tax=Archaeoglobus TaxID=2233 RepID=UPI0025C1E5FE|nr:MULTISPECIES: hypothetical protein [unclassified Archaeoglobus]